jgi:hypothetical protein
MVVRGMATPHSVSSVVVDWLKGNGHHSVTPYSQLWTRGDGRHSLTHSVSSVVMWCGLVEGIATHSLHLLSGDVVWCGLAVRRMATTHSISSGGGEWL